MHLEKALAQHWYVVWKNLSKRANKTIKGPQAHERTVTVIAKIFTFFKKVYGYTRYKQGKSRRTKIGMWGR